MQRPRYIKQNARTSKWWVFSVAIKLCYTTTIAVNRSDVVATIAAPSHIHNKGQIILQEKPSVGRLLLSSFFIFYVLFVYWRRRRRQWLRRWKQHQKADHLCMPVFVRCDDWWINNQNIYFNTQKIWCLHIYEAQLANIEEISRWWTIFVWWRRRWRHSTDVRNPLLFLIQFDCGCVFFLSCCFIGVNENELYEWWW